ncbi:hypothetical protein FACS1894166_02730 [Bacilli bacterium]|nr:hypothetical protein FACS1894166_02730 [Bacilli bacterium]
MVVPTNFGDLLDFTAPLINEQHLLETLYLIKFLSRKCKYFLGIGRDDLKPKQARTHFPRVTQFLTLFTF